MDDTGGREEELIGAMNARMRGLLALALASIIVGGIADLAMDRPAHWLSFHVIFESLMIAGALVMATTLWLWWWRSEHAAAELRASLRAQREDGERWRASARATIEGLRRAMDEQFDRWQLTATEREVALLVLQGYGHKQLAALTGRSERTVRQHASAVYEKSGLAGRAELAAFFLRDLMLLPGESSPAAPPADR